MAFIDLHTCGRDCVRIVEGRKKETEKKCGGADVLERAWMIGRIAQNAFCVSVG